MMHLSVRSRYRLVFICTVILIFRFFLPYGRSNSIEHDITDSINSILRLSARICKTGSIGNGNPNDFNQKPTSLKDDSRPPSLGFKGPPDPLSQLNQGNNRNKDSTQNVNNHRTPPKLNNNNSPSSSNEFHQEEEEPRVHLQEQIVQWGDHTEPKPPRPKSKQPPSKPHPPISDPFPLLSKNLSPFYQNLLKERTKPPSPHPKEETPLFIGFTRNWPQLIQCVTSYIAAGWPAPDIYVVENTGVMYSNRDNKLTLQNPFYLNHTQLSMLGVNVIITPTLLSFSQLQNFYAWQASENNWTEFFWSHQDVVVFSDEHFGINREEQDQIDKFSAGGNNIYDRNSPNSLYHRAVSVLRNLRTNKDGTLESKWANVFFAYDQLTLVHTDAVIGVGGWDTHIPFYTSDCDMYMRQGWAGYAQYSASEVGIILDVANVLDDVGALLRFPGIHATFKGDPGVPIEEEAWWRAVNSLSGDGSKTLGESEKNEDKEEKEKGDKDPYDVAHSTTTPQESFLHEMNILTRQTKQVDRHGETFTNLLSTIERMNDKKLKDNGSNRNTWQAIQSGGQGEPFYRDSAGFEAGILMTIDLGRAVFAEKWGHRGCDVSRMEGVGNEDAWRLERDWDIETEGWGYEGDGW